MMDLGDHVAAFPCPPMIAGDCASPGCLATAEWTIMGPKLMFASLPDVCSKHLTYGYFLGSGVFPSRKRVASW